MNKTTRHSRRLEDLLKNNSHHEHVNLDGSRLPMELTSSSRVTLGEVCELDVPCGNLAC